MDMHRLLVDTNILIAAMKGVERVRAKLEGIPLWGIVLSLAKEADFEEVFIDAPIVRADQHAAGAPK